MAGDDVHGKAQGDRLRAASIALGSVVPVDAPEAPARRVLGALAGRFKLPPDFDAPLPDDEINAFEGG